MITYNKFRPTGMDPKGLGLPDRQDWLVLPCTQSRGSGPYAKSNFIVAQRILKKDKAEFEVHRFGHWGDGWFELILVHPSFAQSVDEIEGCLEQNAFLDDSDASQRQYEAAETIWQSLSLKERIEVCLKFKAHIMASRRKELPNVDRFSEMEDYLVGNQ